MATDAAVQEREETTSPESAPSQPQAGEQQLQKVSAAATIGFGLQARNWDEGFRIANQLAKSELVPKIYKDKPQDIVVAMQLGAELGLPPMQALQSIAVINGKPGIYGDGFLGVIMASPSYARHVEYFVLATGEERQHLTTADLEQLETTAVCSFWRKGNDAPFTATFSVADAKRAGLLGKEGPWRNYPARMLKMRARGFAGRDAFAGELRGMKTTEELNDTPPPPDVSVDRIPEPQRRSDKIVGTSNEPASAEATSANQAETQSPAAGPQKPAGTGKTEAATKAAAGPGQVTRGVRVTETAYIATPKHGDPYWEIKGVVVENGKPTVGHTWHTRDEQVFKLAASCEGTENLFDVTWHVAKQQAKDVKVITGLSAK